MMSVGTFHGVNLLLEVAPEDLDAAERAWLEQDALEGYAQVIIPEYLGRRELYRYKDIHHVEYLNGMFHVGDSRYVPEPRATLNVFKSRTGSFLFRFRHQLVDVQAPGEWVPSIYYYSVPDADSGDEYSGDGQIDEERAGSEAGGTVARRARARRRANSHLTREIVRVGSHTIETDPRSGRWRLDGNWITLGSPEEPLRLARP